MAFNQPHTSPREERSCAAAPSRESRVGGLCPSYALALLGLCQPESQLDSSYDLGAPPGR
jgi:hypothetical protein